MTDDNGPDELLVRLLLHAAPEDKQMLANVFGAADLISRQLPAYAIPTAIRACWLTSIAATATEVGDPYGPALWRAARAYLDEAVGPMLVLVTEAPDDARELDA